MSLLDMLVSIRDPVEYTKDLLIKSGYSDPEDCIYYEYHNYAILQIHLSYAINNFNDDMILALDDQEMLYPDAIDRVDERVYQLLSKLHNVSLTNISEVNDLDYLYELDKHNPYIIENCSDIYTEDFTYEDETKMNVIAKYLSPHILAKYYMERGWECCKVKVDNMMLTESTTLEQLNRALEVSSEVALYHNIKLPIRDDVLDLIKSYDTRSLRLNNDVYYYIMHN